MGYRTVMFAWPYSALTEHRVVTDRQTDRQKDIQHKHDDSIQATALAWLRAVKVFYCHLQRRSSESAGTFQKVVRLGLKNELRRVASAKGARIETPKAPRGLDLGRGCPPPQPTKGSGGASWAPPVGSGAEPRPPTHLQNAAGGDKNSGNLLLLGLKSGTTF